MKTFKDICEECDEEHGKFSRVKNKFSNRPDLHAMILLHKYFPDSMDIIANAQHDQIWLEPRPDDLPSKMTPEEMIDLLRCGVWYESSTDSLSMFV